jgi:hypothetical protein
MVVHACNISTWEMRQEYLEFKASLVYMVSPRSAWATQWDPVLKKKYKRKPFPEHGTLGYDKTLEIKSLLSY